MNKKLLVAFFAFTCSNASAKSLFKTLCEETGKLRAEMPGDTNIKTWDFQSSLASEHQRPTGVRENNMRQFFWKKEGDGKIYLEGDPGGKDIYSPPISSETCTSETTDGLDFIDCRTAKLLYCGKKMALIAFESYGGPRIEIEEKAKIDGESHWLIKTWEKGTTQYYNLTKTPTGCALVLCSTVSKNIE